MMNRHEPICGKCGQGWPCDSAHDQFKADRQAERRRDRLRRLNSCGPGDCLGCGQPVTARHKRITFPGPNLWRSDFGEGALFHARSQGSAHCRSEAETYDRQWVRAWPGRHPLLTCRGFVVEHQDGTQECDNPLCPDGGVPRRGSVVRHGGHYAQCYIVHEVCPRGCAFPAGAERARLSFFDAGRALGFDTSGPQEMVAREPATVTPMRTEVPR